MKLRHFSMYRQLGNLIARTFKKRQNINCILPLDSSTLSSSACPNLSTSAITSCGLLNLVAILWGSQHAIIKLIINDTQPSHYSLLRFAVAALLSSPYTPGIQNLTGKESDFEKVRKTWRWGFEMGIWMFLGFALQAMGMEYTVSG